MPANRGLAYLPPCLTTWVFSASSTETRTCYRYLALLDCVFESTIPTNLAHWFSTLATSWNRLGALEDTTLQRHSLRYSDLTDDQATVMF